MELAEGIKKVGFRRWYERQLIESHAYLITGLLSSILVLGSIESLSSRARARHAEEDEGAGSAPSALGVRCRRCGHEWTIE